MTDMITILGPTATGKTRLAACLANQLGTEVISADSRQVYRGMDVGTGKDYEDYIVGGELVKSHLIDIVDAGYEYNVFEYQKDFLKAYQTLKNKNLTPVLCGGSGMYIEAVLKGYKLIRVPPNENLREELKAKTDAELIKMLKSFKKLHNKTDTDNRKRLLRAIEIETYYASHPEHEDFPDIESLIFGIKFDRTQVRERITERLKARLSGGMIEEVQKLLDEGVNKEKLVYYGLEYKFLSQYLSGQMNYNDMFQKLNSAIHQFAKRQMTWFRKMEREGFNIHWVDGCLSLSEKLDVIMSKFTATK